MCCRWEIPREAAERGASSPLGVFAGTWAQSVHPPRYPSFWSTALADPCGNYWKSSGRLTSWCACFPGLPCSPPCAACRPAPPIVFLFSLQIIRLYTRQILQGLEYLHQNGFTHRDIKGANILVSNDGTIKLADFGTSKRVSVQSTCGNKATLKGTPQWMAPEVIRAQQGSRQWRKADIWSVGCTVIEMATGKPPWSNFSNQMQALYHIAMETSEVPVPGASMLRRRGVARSVTPLRSP